MKKIFTGLAVALACGILAGCSDSAQSPAVTDESPAAPVTDTGTTAPEPEPPYPSTLPLICIETVSQEPGVLDFITEPVAGHVSRQIATWTPHYKMPPEPYYEDCTITVYSAENACLLDETAARVKVRGNWTSNYDKKPLRIRFGEKQSLLQMNDGAAQKNWLLLAEYKDASMLRDRAMLGIAQELLGQEGLYASDTALAEVQVNGVYWGVYLVAEQQQVSKARVNIGVPEADYTGTDIGYFLEFDGYFYEEDALHSFHTGYAENAPLIPFDGQTDSKRRITCLPEDADDPKKDIGFSIKSDIYAAEQRDFIADYVENVYRILYAAAYEQKAMRFNAAYTEIQEAPDITPQQAVEAVVNIRSLADAYIINEIACDADIYWSSFFMSADFSDGGDRKLTFTAPWDFDSGLGNKDRCADGTGFYAANIVPEVNGFEYETINPWLAVLMHEEWYQAIIRQIWTEAYDAGIFADAVSQIRTESAEYADAFARNEERWGISTGDEGVLSELCDGAAACASQNEAAGYLADWLEKRITFLNAYWHA